MLTDNEKEKIELEETYRNEIRNQLQLRPARPSQWGKVLGFLNNAVILWLLSAVFITYGAKKYENL